MKKFVLALVFVSAPSFAQVFHWPLGWGVPITDTAPITIRVSTSSGMPTAEFNCLVSVADRILLGRACEGYAVPTQFRVFVHRLRGGAVAATVGELLMPAAQNQERSTTIPSSSLVSGDFLVVEFHPALVSPSRCSQGMNCRGPFIGSQEPVIAFYDNLK